MTRRWLLPLVTVVAIASATSACGSYRPALFADRPVVTAVRDDLPIPVPGKRSFDERIQVSDVYLRRPLFNDVRPVDFPTGGDVNALDQVVASSWYDAAGPAQRGEPVAPDGPPELPLSVLRESPATNEGALVVRDARGLRYELVGDPPDRPGLHTGADVLGGHLLRQLGYHAPTAWIVELPSASISWGDAKAKQHLLDWLERRGALLGPALRVSATRWPRGIDVGIGNDYSTRADDPNEEIAPHDRRTLRAMKVFGQWIGWTSFGVRRMRDVYVGTRGEGHVVHYLVGTSNAFGTKELKDHPARDEKGRGFWWNLVTLGLYPPVVVPARRSAFASLGYLQETLSPGEYRVSPTYSPFARMTPPDEYWAAKRMLDIGDRALRFGIDAARLPDDAARHLLRVLQGRRRLLVAHGMSVVSPVDPEPMAGRSVLLRDRALAIGIGSPLHTRYLVEFLDTAGNAVAEPALLAATGAATVVLVPEGPARQVVLHIRVIRRGEASPRHCDVHVIAGPGFARIVGVRH